MSARLARQRWWIAGLYCLAAVMAQGFHTHDVLSGGCGEATATDCGEEQHESEGLASSTPALASNANDCPSCEFTLNHQAPLDDRVGFHEVVRRSTSPLAIPLDLNTSASQARSRGPPAC